MKKSYDYLFLRNPILGTQTFGLRLGRLRQGRLRHGQLRHGWAVQREMYRKLDPCPGNPFLGTQTFWAASRSAATRLGRSKGNI